MKRLLSAGIFGVAALALGLGASPASAQQLKIGFVNSQRVLAEAPGVQNAQRALQTELSGYQTEVDSLERTLQAQGTQLQQQLGTLSEQARTQRQQEFQQRLTAAQQRIGQLNQYAQQREAQLVQPVMQQINQAVEEVRREGGFSFIVDASNGFVIAADPALDVTERVLTRLRAMPAPAAPAATNPPAPRP